MNKKAAIIAALGLVAVLAVGAMAVSTNMRFDQDQEVLAQGGGPKAKQGEKKQKPIVKRRTIRRHKTVHDPSPNRVVIGSSTSGGGGNGSSGGSFGGSARASSHSGSGGGGNGGGGSDYEDHGDDHDEHEDEDEHEVEHEDEHEEEHDDD